MADNSITIRIQTAQPRVYAPHITVTEKDFSAQTQQEIEDSLHAAVKEHNAIRWSDFIHPNKLITKLLNPAVELNVTGHNIDAKALEKAVRHISAKNNHIQSIKITDRNNEDPLIAKLKSIIEARDKESNRRTQKMRIAIFLNIAFAAYMSMGATAFVMGLNIAINSFTGWSITRLRQWYLDSATKYFGKKKQIREVDLHDHRVITALEKGARSVRWGQYFLSHFSYSAWRHPRVFAAGMELAVEGKEKHLEIIHEKYANRVR